MRVRVGAVPWDDADAVTVPLTAEQERLASSPQQLWVQGGLPDDPVLERARPGERFGFGALRCSIDDLNGDNVEWIAYPQGSRHVFCFAYYVQPPPPAGTIVVRKEVDAPAGSTAPSFSFTGNVSYEPGGTFGIDAQPGRPGQAVFPRAAQTAPTDEPWRFRENVPAGWERTGLSCASASGASTTAIDAATGEVAVRLGAADTVTCTYVDRLVPPRTGLVLSKRTLGGIGTFGFDVAGPESASQQLTTEEEDVPVAGPPLTLPVGEHQIDETVPAPSPRGHWERTNVICDGQRRRSAVTVVLTADQGEACEFTNRFVPRGAITIRKRTLGRTGTVGFIVAGRTSPELNFRQRVTTRNTDDAFRATGDDTDSMPLGTYEIVETSPTTPDDGYWTLDSALCDGRPVGFAQGRAQIELTADCTYVDRFTSEGSPPRPEERRGDGQDDGGDGGETGVLGESVGPSADLRITKRVRPRVARPGQRVRYTVVVTNRGPGTATRVQATELAAPTLRSLRVRPSRGRCRAGRPSRCELGTLEPGDRVVIHGVARAGRPGRTRNDVAVGSATEDADLSDNRAEATLTVRRPRSPRFAG